MGVPPAEWRAGSFQTYGVRFVRQPQIPIKTSTFQPFPFIEIYIAPDLKASFIDISSESRSTMCNVCEAVQCLSTELAGHESPTTTQFPRITFSFPLRRASHFRPLHKPNPTCNPSTSPNASLQSPVTFDQTRLQPHQARLLMRTIQSFQQLLKRSNRSGAPREYCPMLRRPAI